MHNNVKVYNVLFNKCYERSSHFHEASIVIKNETCKKKITIEN